MCGWCRVVPVGGEGGRFLKMGDLDRAAAHLTLGVQLSFQEHGPTSPITVNRRLQLVKAIIFVGGRENLENATERCKNIVEGLCDCDELSDARCASFCCCGCPSWGFVSCRVTCVGALPDHRKQLVVQCFQTAAVSQFKLGNPEAALEDMKLADTFKPTPDSPGAVSGTTDDQTDFYKYDMSSTFPACLLTPLLCAHTTMLYYRVCGCRCCAWCLARLVELMEEHIKSEERCTPADALAICDLLYELVVSKSSFSATPPTSVDAEVMAKRDEVVARVGLVYALTGFKLRRALIPVLKRSHTIWERSGSGDMDALLCLQLQVREQAALGDRAAAEAALGAMEEAWKRRLPVHGATATEEAPSCTAPTEAGTTDSAPVAPPAPPFGRVSTAPPVPSCGSTAIGAGAGVGAGAGAGAEVASVPDSGVREKSSGTEGRQEAWPSWASEALMGAYLDVSKLQRTQDGLSGCAAAATMRRMATLMAPIDKDPSGAPLEQLGIRAFAWMWVARYTFLAEALGTFSHETDQILRRSYEVAIEYARVVAANIDAVPIQAKVDKVVLHATACVVWASYMAYGGAMRTLRADQVCCMRTAVALCVPTFNALMLLRQRCRSILIWPCPRTVAVKWNGCSARACNCFTLRTCPTASSACVLFVGRALCQLA